jgi:hypothetical protein
MRLTNESSMPAAWTLGFQRDGRELLIVVVKATYMLPGPQHEPGLVAAQVPLVEADCFTGEPGLSAPLYETDYAHYKPACDVLLVGSAYAPPGRRVTRTEVGLAVGAMTKRFAVMGHRRWRKQLLGITATAPEPFERLPITYDCAYGGTDRTEEAEGLTHAYAANPVGRGHWKHTDGIDGQPLPNTEELACSVESHDAQYRPQAFSPIGRNWTGRIEHAGTYDQKWIENEAPFWPQDFDERYFQAAPADQRIAYPQGGEEVTLHGLTPDGHRSFQLPRQPMLVTFIPYRGADMRHQANLDTIVFEPDEGRFTLAWRAVLPLARTVFDVQEIVVGAPAAWHRARRFPGKTYYATLDEAVRARRGRGS